MMNRCRCDDAVPVDGQVELVGASDFIKGGREVDFFSVSQIDFDGASFQLAFVERATS